MVHIIKNFLYSEVDRKQKSSFITTDIFIFSRWHIITNFMCIVRLIATRKYLNPAMLFHTIQNEKKRKEKRNVLNFNFSSSFIIIEIHFHIESYN